MDKFKHAFTATIERRPLGRCTHSAVYLPIELQEELPLHDHPRLRINALVAGVPLNAAWQPTGGRWFLILSRRFMKDRELSVGEKIEIRFNVADQKAVDVPKELRTALEDNRNAKAEWEKLTPGRRRGHSYRVSSARRVETRKRRASEVVEALLPLRFPVPQKKETGT